MSVLQITLVFYNNRNVKVGIYRGIVYINLSCKKIESIGFNTTKQ